MAEASRESQTLSPEVERQAEFRSGGLWSTPERIEPSPAALPEEPSKPEVRPEGEQALKEAIEGASSIEELCQILQAVPRIPEGHQRVLGSGVALSIQRANQELERNLDEIIIYTITRERNQAQREFSGRFIEIDQGGDLGIQDKVRALMKARMNERFESRKREFMVDSVASIRSFDALYRVLRQFTVIDDKVVRWEREPQEVRADNREVRSIEELVKLIEGSVDHVEHLTKQKRFLDQEPSDVYAQIGEVLNERLLPRDSGIFQKVQQLIFEKVKEEYIDRASSESQSAQSSEAAKPGFVKRGLSRLRGLLPGRKKK